MKLTLTLEQWKAMVPAISRIDGNCSVCIEDFLDRLEEVFEVPEEIKQELLS